MSINKIKSFIRPNPKIRCPECKNELEYDIILSAEDKNQFCQPLSTIIWQYEFSKRHFVVIEPGLSPLDNEILSDNHIISNIDDLINHYKLIKKIGYNIEWVKLYCHCSNNDCCFEHNLLIEDIINYFLQEESVNYTEFCVINNYIYNKSYISIIIDGYCQNYVFSLMPNILNKSRHKLKQQIKKILILA